MEDENTYVRTILSWISAREPQFSMIYSSFKLSDKLGVGYHYTQADFDQLYGKIGDLSEIPISEKFPVTHNKPNFQSDNPKDGVWTDKPREPPKKQVWTPKPIFVGNPLDTLPKRNPLRYPQKVSSKGLGGMPLLSPLQSQRASPRTKTNPRVLHLRGTYVTTAIGRVTWWSFATAG